MAGWGSLIPPTLDKELFFIFSSEMLGQCLCSAAELALGLYCSASSSSGDPGPLPVASVEAVWSHPRVSVRAISFSFTLDSFGSIRVIEVL